MGSLFQNLKKRKVFTIAAVYAVVAWLTIQIVDVISDPLNLPEWFQAVTIVLFAIGFPIALLLAWAYEVTPDGIKIDSGHHGQTQTPAPQGQRLIYATFVLVLLAVGFQFGERFLFGGQPAISQPAAITSPQDSTVMRFSLPVSEDGDLYLGGGDSRYGRPGATSLAFSNDGKQLFYSAWQPGTRGETSNLYMRQLDQERAQVIEGTEGGSGPFLSPDNAWVGFYTEDSIRRVPVGGGIAQTIVAGGESGRFGLFGASWGYDDTIVYGDLVPGSRADGLRYALYRVEASGGSGELLADPIESLGQFREYSQPQLLQGSELLLFQGLATSGDPERAEVLALNLATGIQTSLLTNATNPRFVPETGHLLFMRQGLLMAVGFDPDEAVIKGEPVIVAENVMHSFNMPSTGWNTGVGQLAISPAGHLIYVRGGINPDQASTVVRVTLDGEAEILSSISQSTPDSMHYRLSPDGSQLAFTSIEADGTTIHIHDLARNVTREMNTGGFRNVGASWSPDGESIVFSSNREDGIGNLYRVSSDGSSERPERLAPANQVQLMQSLSRDGDIAYLQGADIWVLSPDGEPEPFFTSNSIESHATFSPDGRWLAYISSEEGPNGGEVYIRPYPGSGAAILIAGNDNVSPTWSRDGTQLYYLQRNRDTMVMRMMAVDIVDGVPSSARTLIEPWPYGNTFPLRSFEVLEDGSFIASRRMELSSNETSEAITYAEQMAVTEMQVVLNFSELLRERVN